MRKSVIALLIVFIIILLIIILVNRSKTVSPGAFPAATTGRLEMPYFNSSDQIVKHAAYTLQYNEENEEPDWVAYFITKDRLNGNASRENNFRADPLVKTGSAEPEDYRRTGYDRGHMAPAADFTWSHEAMSESFYLSNMCPQLHSFNAGIWEVLEEQARTWAGAPDDTLFITAGPLLTKNLPTVGKRNKLAVPEYFYKAILRKSLSGYSAAAFLIKHEDTDRPLSDFAITVDSLEKITHIDFFCKLPQNIQADVESKFEPDKWPGITSVKKQFKRKALK